MQPLQCLGLSLAQSPSPASWVGVSSNLTSLKNLSVDSLEAINVSLAFCMGTDIEGLMNNPIGQPMATIFFNSFGQKGTLAVWAFVVIVQ